MAALKPVKVGLIGCGMIANNAYMPTILKNYSFIDVVKCADAVQERADLFEQKYGCKAVTSNDDIYGDPEIDIVLNLTYPTSHLEVTRNALKAGKHVHTEKMMGCAWEDGLELAKLAAECEKKGQWYTNAPDTFLGGSWQSIRQLIDSGYIGTPMASYCLVTRGNMILGAEFGKSTRRELPKQEGGDDMMARFARMRLPGFNPRTPVGSGLPYDMGGYYLHNLINLFGNINRCAGYVKTNVKSNSSNDPLNTNYKNTEPNNEPDTLVGSLEFDNGVYGSIIFAAGINTSEQAFIVYGSDATIICPDPNFFGGKFYIRKGMNFTPGGLVEGDSFEIPSSHGIMEEGRGVGLLDLAFAIRNDRKPRCHHSMGFQTFETVHGLIDSANNGVNHKMVSHVDRPAAVRPGIFRGTEQQVVFDD